MNLEAITDASICNNVRSGKEKVSNVVQPGQFWNGGRVGKMLRKRADMGSRTRWHADCSLTWNAELKVD